MFESQYPGVMDPDTMTTTLRSQMYGNSELTEHQWHLLGEILCRQVYAVEDAVRACQRRAGEAVGEFRLRGREE